MHATSVWKHVFYKKHTIPVNYYTKIAFLFEKEKRKKQKYKTKKKKKKKKNNFC